MNNADVYNAVNLVLVAAYPNRPVYPTRVSDNFVRPSFLLTLHKATSQSVTPQTLRNSCQIRITAFVEMDDYGNCDELALMSLQDAVLHLFDAGYLVISDRAPKITASAGGSNPGEAYVDLNVVYDEDKLVTRPAYESMGNMNLKMEVDTNGNA